MTRISSEPYLLFCLIFMRLSEPSGSNSPVCNDLGKIETRCTCRQVLFRHLRALHPAPLPPGSRFRVRARVRARVRVRVSARVRVGVNPSSCDQLHYLQAVAGFATRLCVLVTNYESYRQWLDFPQDQYLLRKRRGVPVGLAHVLPEAFTTEF